MEKQAMFIKIFWDLATFGRLNWVAVVQEVEQSPTNRKFRSACWSILGQDTEPQIALNGSSIGVCVRMNGYRSWWAAGAVHGSLCHEWLLQTI